VEIKEKPYKKCQEKSGRDKSMKDEGGRTKGFDLAQGSRRDAIDEKSKYHRHDRYNSPAIYCRV
ncbi:MAG: hypothetical protein EA341_01530, partial [Mongoliibacter sp.]|uniref:hypothetical protein n=1 Tax=Mongoliibacter sp. TaxID=2022438 RepID=UPI0012EFDD27